MNDVEETAAAIFDESKGFAKAHFSIIPYKDDVLSLDPQDWIVWHADYSQLYFEKLMTATAFAWKDLSWDQWQTVLLRRRHDYQALLNLSIYLTRYLEVDAFRTLKQDLDVDDQMISRLKVFMRPPLSRLSEKEQASMASWNEMAEDFGEISSRLHRQGAPKAELTDPDVISL